METLVKDVEFNVTSTSLFNRISPNTIFAVSTHDHEVFLSIFFWDDKGMHEIFGPKPFDEFQIEELEDSEDTSLIIEDVENAPRLEVALTLMVNDYVFTMTHDPTFLNDILVPRMESLEEITAEVDEKAREVLESEEFEEERIKGQEILEAREMNSNEDEEKEDDWMY